MILTTYDTLKQYTDAFGDGRISLLVIKGRGATGKSHIVANSVEDSDCLQFNGHATPLSIYLGLHDSPDSLVVFDDVDSLINNKITVSLLKQICEMNKKKTIRYNTTYRIGEGGIPSSFISTNKVCLICNDFKRVGKNIRALLTRAIFIDFWPTNQEILNQLKGFKDLDLEIFSYLKANSKTIGSIHFRIYIKCKELKNADLDWKDYLSKEYKINELDRIASELIDLPVKERDDAWVKATGKSVRCLQRRLRKLGGG